MNCRFIAQIPLEIKAKPFLCPTAQSDHDMARAALFNLQQQSFVGNRRAVHGCNVDIVGAHLDSVVIEPTDIALRRRSCRHDPERGTCFTEFLTLNQCPQIFKSGKLRDTVSLDQIPNQHHQRTIRNREIRT